MSNELPSVAGAAHIPSLGDEASSQSTPVVVVGEKRSPPELEDREGVEENKRARLEDALLELPGIDSNSDKRLHVA